MGNPRASWRRHCEARPWRGHHVATVHDADVSAMSCTPTAPQSPPDSAATSPAAQLCDAPRAPPRGPHRQ